MPSRADGVISGERTWMFIRMVDRAVVRGGQVPEGRLSAVAAAAVTTAAVAVAERKPKGKI